MTPTRVVAYRSVDGVTNVMPATAAQIRQLRTTGHVVVVRRVRSR